MSTQHSRQRGRGFVPATPELYRELLEELSMLYVEYQHADGTELQEARPVEVVDDSAPVVKERWYQRLLMSFVPIWLPASKVIPCWSLAGILMEDRGAYVYLSLSVETGQPYIMLSPAFMADRLIPSELTLTLSEKDVKELIVRVKAERVQVLALIIIKEH